MSFVSLFNFLGGNSSKKLGKAIEEHDLNTMRQCLEAGVGTKNFDYLLMREGDRPGEMVPAGKFTHPMKLARHVGMRENGLSLLAQYGMADDEYVANRKNYGRT